MSEQTTRDLIERYFHAFNAVDYTTMEQLLDDDVAHDINQGQREIGRDAFRRFNIQMGRYYRETLRDIQIMVAPGGGRAAAEFTVYGTYLETAPGMPPATGQSYTIAAGIFFDVDDEKITRVTTYYNVEAWKEQVS